MIRPSYILILLSCFTYHIDALCPSGYEQVGGYKADIPGCGMIPCDSRYTFNDASSCSQKCDEIGHCMSFSWAPLGDDPNHASSSVCTLYNSELSTTIHGNGNQYMCKKSNQQTITIDDVTYIDRGDHLYPHNKYESNSAFISSNRLFALVLHSDGSLQIYYIPDNMFMWRSNNPTGSSTDNRHLIYQSDANLVLYGPNNVALWSNNEHGDHDPGFCSIQVDANFVCYDKDNIFQWNAWGYNNYYYFRPSYPSYPTYPSNGIGYLYANHNGGEWCLSAGHVNNNAAAHSLNWGEQNMYWCKNHGGQTCKCLGLTADSAGHLSYEQNGVKYVFERDSSGAGKWNLKADIDGEGNRDDFDLINGRRCHTMKENDSFQRCCIVFETGDVIRTYVDVMDFQQRSGIEAVCREVDVNDMQTGAQIKWKN